MAEGEGVGNDGVWMDGDDNPPDYLRYNGEGNKNAVLTRSMQKTVLKQSIRTLARSEVKSAIQLWIEPHRPMLST